MRRLTLAALLTAVASLIASCSSSGGDSDSPSDKALKKRVEQAFTQLGHADGVHFTMQINAEAGDRHLERCITTTVEKKSASPNGLRVGFGYGESDECELRDVRRAFIDGPVAYLPDAPTPSGTCDARYRRAKVTGELRGQLREKIGQPTTSRAKQLVSVATDFRSDGNDVIVEIDPDKAADVLDSIDSLPEGAEASMRIEFDPSGKISSFGTSVQVEDASVHMVLTVSDMGQLQHLTLPSKQCVQPGDGSVSTIDEFVDSVVH